MEVDGEPVAPQQLMYVLLNKPPGTVTTARDPQGRPTVVQLVADVRERIVPVGRLDADTTGALLLTNDGALAHRLAHPRYGVDKVYEVDVEGEPDDEALRRLAEGVELDDGTHGTGAGPPTRRLEARADPARRPQAPGEAHVRGGRPSGAPPPSQRLCRTEIEGLEPGAWRELEPSEVERLGG